MHVATSGVGTAERPRVAVLYDEFGGEDAGDRACDEVALPPAAAASVEADDGASADAAAIADVLVVTTPEQAAAAAAVLVAHARRPGAPVYHAVDTEVDGIDLKNETPVGHGQLVSFSVYGGPDLDLGGGKTRLWVDVLCDDGCLNTAVLEPFRAYLEDDAVKKVWHNYAFDRHTFSNAGVTPRGFGGDTMCAPATETATPRAPPCTQHACLTSPSQAHGPPAGLFPQAGGGQDVLARVVELGR